MTPIILLFIRWGLSERLARVAAWTIPVALGIALLAVLWLFLSARENADDLHNQSMGAASQRAEDMAQQIDRVETANHAEETIRSDDDARRASCMHHSRTPENCH